MPQLGFHCRLFSASFSLSSRAGAQLGGKARKSSFTVSSHRQAARLLALWRGSRAFQKLVLDASLSFSTRKSRCKR